MIGTLNNGSTWSLQSPPANAVDVTGISCANAADCIAVGNNGNNGAGSTIMATTNGGAAWTAEMPPAGISRLSSVSCPSTADCFAAGDTTVLTSTNAGYAWRAQSIPAEVSGLTGISCVTTMNCVAVGFGIFGSPVIIRTSNGGTTWSTVPVPAGVGALSGLSCVTNSTCQAVSDYHSGSPSILVSRDGGGSWNRESFPLTVTDFTAISCADASNCTTVGSSSIGPGPAILSTRNGGSNWVPQTVPTGVTALNGVSCSSDTTCVAVGSEIIQTSDGGSHWVNLGNPTRTTTFEGVSCFSTTNCTVVGGANILDSTNSGATWTGQVVPTGIRNLVGVACAGGANCETVGSGDNFGGAVVTLSAPPTITTTTVTSGTIGIRYVATLAAAGGLAPYKWAISAGALPPGLAMSPNGTISGLPIISGDYTVTFSVTDANNLSSLSTLTIAIRPIAAPGYWEVARDGGIFSYGGAQFYGSTGNLHLNAPIVGMAATPDDAGYWLVASDGGIFAFGDAIFYGSTGNLPLNAPIVAMTPTPDGGGYWLIASDGGVFAFGDASFYGSTGSLALNSSIVGMASTIDGLGYWLVASDGGIFAFGDATFFGSAGGLPLDKPIVAMTTDPAGNGYWLVASDGGIFSFGNVGYYGSTGGIPLNAPIVGTDRTADGQGYWMVARDGGMFSFGDAEFYGSAGSMALNQPVVGMVAIQSTASGAPSAASVAPLYDLPELTAQPTDQTAVPGGTATFAAPATGSPTPTVQWQVSSDRGAHFNDIPGADADTLTLGAVSLTEQSDRYRAVFTNAAGSVTSASAKLIVGSPQVPAPATSVDSASPTASSELPDVLAQPVDQTAGSGGTATFTVVASGVPSPAVQWQLSDGRGARFDDIAGAHAPALTVALGPGEQLNRYRAVLTNTAGSDTSASAGLSAGSMTSGTGLAPPSTASTIAPPQSGLPDVVVQPTDQTTGPSSSTTFTAMATGSPTPTVQWQVSSDRGAHFNDIPGADADTLTLGAVSLTEQSDRYRAVFTNAAGSVTSASAKLIVGSPQVPAPATSVDSASPTASSELPDVLAQPVDQTAGSGGTATFTVVASGVPSPAVQWQLSDGRGARFDDIAGAHAPALTVALGPGEQLNRYRAVLTNTAGSDTSASAGLSAGSMTSGTGLAPPSTASTIAPPQSGLPDVVVQPTDQTTGSSSSTTFTAMATGSPTPTVQWQVSSDRGAHFNDIPGADADTLTLGAVSLTEQSDRYRAVFTNAAGSVTSASAKLIVGSPQVPAPATSVDSASPTASSELPDVLAQPVDQTAGSGGTATFTVVASGVPSPAVQWQLSDGRGARFDDIAGAHAPALTVALGPGEQLNRYRAVLTNTAGSDTSASAGLSAGSMTSGTGLAPPSTASTIAPPQSGLPDVVVQPTDQTTGSSSSTTFTAMATGSPTPTVQWQVSSDRGAHFNDIPGADADTLTLGAVSLTEQSDRYRAVFTNAAGAVTSASATLVSPVTTGALPAPVETAPPGVPAGPVSINGAAALTLPQFRAEPADQVTTLGGSATFTVVPLGQSDPLVQWQESTDGGRHFDDIAGAHGLGFTVTDVTAGDQSHRYRAVMTSPAGSVTSAQVGIVVSP